MITLKRIGYAAAAVSSAGASIYMLSTTLRKRKLNPLWSFDGCGAPPLAIQRQLEGEESEESEDEDATSSTRKGRGACAEQTGDDSTRLTLQAKMQRAIQRGDTARIRELSHLIDELDGAVGTRDRQEAGQSQSNKRQPGCHVRLQNTDDREELRARLMAKMQRAALQQNAARIADLSKRIQELDRHPTDSSDDDVSQKAQTQMRNSRSTPKGKAAPSKRLDSVRKSHHNGMHNNRQDNTVSSSRQQPSHLKDSMAAHLDDDDSCSDWEGEHGSADAASTASDGGTKRFNPPRTRRGAQERLAVNGEADSIQAAEQRRKPARAPPAALVARPSAVQAIANFQTGDLIKAECPCTGEWVDATAHELHTSSGILVVRWHNPGVDSRGRPFHPLGEVYADRVKLAFRKHSHQGSPQAIAEGPDQLQVGDACFAVGSHLTEKHWFQAKLLSIRERPPEIRVEYTATFDGDPSPLRLPEPRKAFVDRSLVCREAPASMSACNTQTAAIEGNGLTPNGTSPCFSSADASAEGPEPGRKNTKDDAIDADLMCSICSRPDGESLMLICEGCKSGYHTYCLDPPLSVVPDVDAWYCATCQATDAGESEQ